ncbi:hypothetical protein GCM10011574_39380 [Microbispora bryophytorum]|uniref:Uncharacterized protein n=1 Tax=Microbispora bryophytorum TaxID=1460882 RepID=A0A8H9H445_9ACTN|nr:hypothetical protein GCM10011574_39380 [Microbispora bryophytorum]
MPAVGRAGGRAAGPLVLPTRPIPAEPVRRERRGRRGQSPARRTRGLAAVELRMLKVTLPAR